MWRVGFISLVILAACSSNPAAPATDLVDDASPTDAREGAVPVTIDWAQWHAPGADFAPWVRWWWPGNDVDGAELVREIEALAAAGFGGAEIQAFNAALDPLADEPELERRLSVDSAAYWSNVHAALDAAAAAGIRLDLTLGSGWPTGGPHVAPDHSMQTLVWGEATVSGGVQVTVPVPPPEMPAFYQVADMAAGFGEPMARYLLDEALLVAVVAARVTGGSRDANPLILDDVVTLDPNSALDLTFLVQGQTVTFMPGTGNWRVIAFYKLPDGQFPSLPATTEPGFVMDYLDASVVAENLAHWLPDSLADKPALRGFFTDSFELKTERWFCDDFLTQFANRRGYSLVPYLPGAMLPGADNHIFDGAGLRRISPFSFGELDSRIQYDYARTLSDLFLERFVAQANDASVQGHALVNRVQGYGLNIDVIAAAGLAEIPEAEQLYAGGTELFLRLVASGAHLGRRNVISAESLVFADRAHLTTPAKMRAAADKLFAAGFNQLVYHGFPYLKQEGYGESGWHAFCSPFSGLGTFASNIAESSPFWPDMKRLNGYVGRMQYLMRLGEPERGALYYYPFMGVSASLMRMEDRDELFFNGDFPGEAGGGGGNPLFALVDTLFGEKSPPAGAQWLEQMSKLELFDDPGTSWDFANDDSLRGITVAADGTLLLTNGLRYQSVILVHVPTIPADIAEDLAACAEGSSGRVRVIGAPPVRQPGFLDWETGDARVEAAMDRIIKRQNLFSWNWETSIVPAPFKSHRRRLSSQSWLAHIFNPTATEQSLSFPPAGTCEKAWFVDVWKDQWWPAHGPVSVPALSSLVFMCNVPTPDAPGPTYLPRVPPSGAIPLTGWTLTATGDDIAQVSMTLDLNTPLPDWTTMPLLRYSSSTGHYETEFQLAIETGRRYVLQAHWVWGRADVTVNGHPAGTLLVSPFDLDVTPLLTSGINTIALTYTPTLRNRFVGYANQALPEYPQFKSDPERLAPTGIVGEVQLLVFEEPLQ